MTLAGTSGTSWILQAVLLLIAATTVDCVAGDNQDGLVLGSTVRIRYERSEKGALITGHGTAFGVDLSQFGFKGRRYLLSAAHNVLDENKQPHSTLKVEIQENSRTYWSHCKVVASDANLDVCLVEAGDELSCVLQLADVEPPVGSTVAMAGSPRGVPVAIFKGVVTEKFFGGSVRSLVRIPFDHGDSGGPILHPDTTRIVGLAVAGVPKNGDLDHELGLYVPIVAIMTFLDAHRKNENASAQRSAPAAQIKCSLKEVVAAPKPAVARSRRQSSAQLVAALDQRQLAVNSISARMDVILRQSSGHKDYKFDGVYLGDAAGNLRLRVGLGESMPLFDFSICGDRVELWLPQKNMYYRGSRQDLINSQGELALLAEIGRARDLFFPRPWSEGASERRLVRDEARQIVNVIEKSGSAARCTRKMILAPDVVAVDSTFVYGASGREVGAITYGDFRQITSSPACALQPELSIYPGHISLAARAGIGRLELIVQECEVNAAISTDRFAVPPPAHAKCMELGPALKEDANLLD